MTGVAADTGAVIGADGLVRPAWAAADSLL